MTHKVETKVVRQSRIVPIVAIGGLMLGTMAVALVSAQAANQIVLAGTIAQNCSVNVTTNPAAAALNLTEGVQRVTVGTVLQSCNKKAGYTLSVASTNCAAAPTGAKLIGTAVGESLAYSVEAQNPTTGGSTPSVTGLLASTCTNQNVRVVSNAKIDGATSTVFANYTGDAGLSADTYQDTLTFTMNVN